MHGWRLNASRNISLSATLSARASKVAGSCSRGLSQRRDAPRGPSSDSCAIHNYPSVIVTAILYVVLRTASNAAKWHVRLELFSGCNPDILCIDGGPSWGKNTERTWTFAASPVSHQTAQRANGGRDEHRRTCLYSNGRNHTGCPRRFRSSSASTHKSFPSASTSPTLTPTC